MRNNPNNPTRILISWLTALACCAQWVVPFPLSAQPAPALQIIQPGQMLGPSSPYTPPLIKGLKIYPEDPLRLGFVVDRGDSSATDAGLKDEAQRLIKYFFAALTIPKKELWVNLSPYEADRMVPQGLGETEMGRDLLAQDYLLKQLTASLIYPESDLGKEFWDKVYKEVYARYGTTDIPINTFNKVWIVTDKAVVYENAGSAFVVGSHLRVMLEEDYMKMDSERGGGEGGESLKSASHIYSKIVREIVVPALEKEVNEGQNFAVVRQIYNSLILAHWYKKALAESILGRVYVDQNKTLGVDMADKTVKQKIYDQYIEAFQKGAFNLVKEEYDETVQEYVHRKYFSGGFVDSGEIKTFDRASLDQMAPGDRRDLAALVEGADHGKTILFDVAAVENANPGEQALAGDRAGLGVDKVDKAHIQNVADKFWDLLFTGKKANKNFYLDKLYSGDGLSYNDVESALGEGADWTLRAIFTRLWTVGVFKSKRGFKGTYVFSDLMKKKIKETGDYNIFTRISQIVLWAGPESQPIKAQPRKINPQAFHQMAMSPGDVNRLKYQVQLMLLSPQELKERFKEAFEKKKVAVRDPMLRLLNWDRFISTVFLIEYDKRDNQYYVVLERRPPGEYDDHAGEWDLIGGEVNGPVLKGDPFKVKEHWDRLERLGIVGPYEKDSQEMLVAFVKSELARINKLGNEHSIPAGIEDIFSPQKYDGSQSDALQALKTKLAALGIKSIKDYNAKKGHIEPVPAAALRYLSLATGGQVTWTLGDIIASVKPSEGNEEAVLNFPFVVINDALSAEFKSKGKSPQFVRVPLTMFVASPEGSRGDIVAGFLENILPNSILAEGLGNNGAVVENFRTLMQVVLDPAHIEETGSRSSDDSASLEDVRKSFYAYAGAGTPDEAARQIASILNLQYRYSQWENEKESVYDQILNMLLGKITMSAVVKIFNDPQWPIILKQAQVKFMTWKVMKEFEIPEELAWRFESELMGGAEVFSSGITQNGSSNEIIARMSGVKDELRQGWGVSIPGHGGLNYAETIDMTSVLRRIAENGKLPPGWKEIPVNSIKYSEHEMDGHKIFKKIQEGEFNCFTLNGRIFRPPSDINSDPSFREGIFLQQENRPKNVIYVANGAILDVTFKDNVLKRLNTGKELVEAVSEVGRSFNSTLPIFLMGDKLQFITFQEALAMGEDYTLYQGKDFMVLGRRGGFYKGEVKRRFLLQKDDPYGLLSDLESEYFRGEIKSKLLYYQLKMKTPIVGRAISLFIWGKLKGSEGIAQPEYLGQFGTAQNHSRIWAKELIDLISQFSQFQVKYQNKEDFSKEFGHDWVILRGIYIFLLEFYEVLKRNYRTHTDYTIGINKTLASIYHATPENKRYDNFLDSISEWFVNIKKMLDIASVNETPSNELSLAFDGPSDGLNAPGAVALESSPARFPAEDLGQVDERRITPGGIDLSQVDVQIRRDGHGVALPLAQQDIAQISPNIKGFCPIITSYQVIPDLTPFLGIQVR